MELEGYGLVMNAISIALRIRTAVKNHPLISKYFRILGADELIPEAYRQSGFKDYLAPGTDWGAVVKATCAMRSSVTASASSICSWPRCTAYCGQR